MSKQTYEWDETKELYNLTVHGVSFSEAQLAFEDPKRIIVQDKKHSHFEDRFFCIGCVNESILTVRFTYRNDNVRIIGAGYWRKGEYIYEEKNRFLH